MKLSGERTVPASRARIWALLFDPLTLKACIPGCEEFEQIERTIYKATMVSKVGPIKARFAGQVILDDTDLPHSCRLSGEGAGGVAGFVKGSAILRVEEAAGGSRLLYDADVEIGGKIAALGDRLFRGVAERNINQLFDTLQERMSAAA